VILVFSLCRSKQCCKQSTCVCITFAKQNSGSGNCSTLPQVVSCYRVLVDQVKRKEREWKVALRSGSRTNEARWLSDSLRDLTCNLCKLHGCRVRSALLTRQRACQTRRTLSHWFHGNLSRFDIDREEVLVINTVRHSLLRLIRRCHRHMSPLNILRDNAKTVAGATRCTVWG